VADRFKARYFVILAPAVTAVMMSCLGIAPNYWVLAILLDDHGHQFRVSPRVGPVMTGNVSGRKLGLGMSIWMVGGESGRFVGPLVIGLALPVLTIQRFSLAHDRRPAGLRRTFLYTQEDGRRIKAASGQEITWRQMLHGKGKVGGNPDRIHYRARLYECSVW